MNSRNSFESSPGTSRFGGEPDLPPGAEWPMLGGEPMAFVAQLRMSDVVPHEAEGALPSTGFLWFFHDATRARFGSEPGDRGSWAVLHEPKDLATLVRTAPPVAITADGRIGPALLEFSSAPSMPPMQSDHVAQLGLIGYERHLYWKLWKAARTPRPHHQLLGHAVPVTSPMEELCQLVSNGVRWGEESFLDDPRVGQLIPGLWDWRLLLQVDTDAGAGIRWGTHGTLYYWIRKQDLEARAFDRAWAILQVG